MFNPNWGGGAIFTDSALWAGSVMESPCPCVCLDVCLYVPSGAVFLERSSSHPPKFGVGCVCVCGGVGWVSCVMCHVSHVTCHVSHVTFFFSTNERPGIWSCDLYANENPRKKMHPMAQTHRQKNGHGYSMTDPAQRAESVKMPL